MSDRARGTARRYRVWPAGLLALVGILGAGAVATQAAPASRPPTCTPVDPAHQVSLSAFTVGALTAARPAANGAVTPPTSTPQVCADVDPDVVTVTPAPNPDV